MRSTKGEPRGLEKDRRQDTDVTANYLMLMAPEPQTLGPGGGQEALPFEIRPFQLDVNGHVP